MTWTGPDHTPDHSEGPLDAAYTLVGVVVAAVVVALLLGGVASWVTTGSLLP